MNYSVLTSVYHKENPEFLRLSMESILNQTVPTNDYVVVKDGPLTDELEVVISDFQKIYENINVVSLQENVGLGCALNAGLKECKNELVARMDTDDIALEERCEIQLNEFINNPGLDIVGSSMYEFYDDPSEIISIKQVPIHHEEIYKYGRRRNPFNHSTVMYKKSKIMESGGYCPLRRGQDIELFTRLLYKGLKAKNISKPLVKFRTNNNMLKRRKSWLTTKNLVGVIFRSWRMGYARLFDVIYMVVMQLTLMIIPSSLGRWIYQNFYREKSNDIR